MDAKVLDQGTSGPPGGFATSPAFGEKRTNAFKRAYAKAITDFVWPGAALRSLEDFIRRVQELAGRLWPQRNLEREGRSTQHSYVFALNGSSFPEAAHLGVADGDGTRVARGHSLPLKRSGELGACPASDDSAVASEPWDP